MSLSKLFAAALALSIGGCTAFQTRDESRYWYYVPVGSTLELTREIRVPAERARVWIPSGQPAPGLNELVASCNFEVRTLSELPRVIHPGVFHVTRVRIEPYVWVVSRPAPLRVAALDLSAMGSFDGGDAADIAPTVHMYLSSPDQPEVMRLSCRGPMDHPSRARTPSIAEIRRALGDWVRLELASE